MKAKELNCKDLMVGDWVMVYPWDETPWEPKKITDINFHSWEGTDYCDSVGVEKWDELSLDQIKPIQLTKEILEKNGFSCDANGMNDSDELVVSVEYGEYQRNTDDGFKVLADGKAIKYVHELQHALRLCGVDKKIEL